MHQIGNHVSLLIQNNQSMAMTDGLVFISDTRGFNEIILYITSKLFQKLQKIQNSFECYYQIM